jgi:predicted Zn-dependent protease
MLDRLERIAGSARGYAELRLHRNTSRQLFMRRGTLIQNSSTTLAGSSARCYALGTFGFASVPAEDDAALEHVLKEARTNADQLGRRAAYTDRTLPVTPNGEGVWDHSTIVHAITGGSLTGVRRPASNTMASAGTAVSATTRDASTASE